MESYKITDVMEKSGVGFGTSGARGLVEKMADKICYLYTQAFIQHLEKNYELKEGSSIAIAGDLRPSTDRIMEAVARAIQDKGYTAINSGKVPSPAVAYLGLLKKIPAIMVTGSHIPDDRNGIKFNSPKGEILKSDELGIKEQVVEIDPSLFNDAGSFYEPGSFIPPLDDEAAQLYSKRYTDYFPSDFLKGLNIGMYQHSAVGRDLLPQILEKLGAKVERLGRAEKFIPVDTEAIRPEDAKLAQEWASKGNYDMLFSTDGDSDRPLIADAKGNWLRGDVAGILVARYLKADWVSVPVSCNSAVELSNYFKKVDKTRIGSPFVIESMDKGNAQGFKSVVGYEANGGFFTNSPSQEAGKKLLPLPTRDTLIVALGIVGLMKQENKSLAELLKTLPPRFTYSDRLKEFPTEKSQSILKSLKEKPKEKCLEEFNGLFENKLSSAVDFNDTDGIKFFLENGEIVHLRPSGNAPEFRCYTEAGSAGRAAELGQNCLKIMESWR